MKSLKKSLTKGRKSSETAHKAIDEIKTRVKEETGEDLENDCLDGFSSISPGSAWPEREREPWP
jgi:hypothetical protein